MGRVGKLINSSGQVSIFLCIVMTGLLVIIFLLVDAARIKAAEIEVQNAADRSIRSVLADTQYELITQYGIFASDFSGDKPRDTFQNYLKMNLERNGEYGSWLINCKLENAEITSIYNLSDTLVFKKQILEFMKYRGPVYLSLELYEKIKSLNNLENVFKKEKESAENADRDIKNKAGGQVQTPLPSKDENLISRYKKLLEDINKNLNGRILSEEISTLKALENTNIQKDKKDYIELADNIDSYYEVEGTDGAEASSLSGLRSFLGILETPLNATRDTLYVNEYIMHQFSSFTGVKSDRELPRAEIEYLIFHNSSEKMNVLAAHALIGGLRFAVRFMETFINNKIPDVRWRLVWSLIKGIYLSMDDVTRLFDSDYEKQHMGVELCDEYKNIRLTYKDYLRVLLFTVEEDTLLRRMQELLQANIHENEQSGMPGFTLTECSTYMEGEVTASIRLWFLPLLRLDKFGSQNIKGGRYYIRKRVYCGY